MKNILFILLGFILGVTISTAYAKYESGTNDAPAVVAYGKLNGALIAVKVDSAGVLQTN